MDTKKITAYKRRKKVIIYTILIILSVVFTFPWAIKDGEGIWTYILMGFLMTILFGAIAVIVEGLKTELKKEGAGERIRDWWNGE